MGSPGYLSATIQFVLCGIVFFSTEVQGWTAARQLEDVMPAVELEAKTANIKLVKYGSISGYNSQKDSGTWIEIKPPLCVRGVSSRNIDFDLFGHSAYRRNEQAITDILLLESLLKVDWLWESSSWFSRSNGVGIINNDRRGSSIIYPRISEIAYDPSGAEGRTGIVDSDSRFANFDEDDRFFQNNLGASRIPSYSASQNCQLFGRFPEENGGDREYESENGNRIDKLIHIGWLLVDIIGAFCSWGLASFIFRDGWRLESNKTRRDNQRR